MRRAPNTAAAGSPTDRKPSPRKRPVAVRALTGALLFQGVSGIVGGYGLVSDPSGRSLGFPPGWLQGSPFPDYLVPGLVLLTALGVLPLLVAYGVWTGRSWSWRPAIADGLVLMQGVLARPATEPLSGGTLAWAVVWRGVCYGAADGILLFAIPWIVAWRAFGAEGRGWGRRVGAGVVAYLGILLVTTAYHLGYADFRSRKILQPNIGSTLGSVPTLLTANPVASPVSHVFLHVAAVVHVPQTELFLPPHRQRP